MQITKLQLNQILHYTCFIVLKLATSLGALFSDSAPGKHISFFRRNLQRWRVIDNSVSDLTGQRFEPQTFNRSMVEWIERLLL